MSLGVHGPEQHCRRVAGGPLGWRLDLELFGWNFNWLVLFLILSLAFGFASKGLLGVEI